ncbi:hypothetical protein V9L05_24175 (plasmid) [Bernardetia sp. Wsw4-3y2]|uniref:hypothetical protein n=1 Tax=Bernardetia sp. Wsw4-3y2 TaxID=3127471 RepID=UPI0030D0F16A
MGTAWFNEDPDIRTEFKNLNIITPHIEAAYFAKKVVTRQENNELSVSFERIPRTFLGRDTYVIIKMANTSQVRNEVFKLSILTENKNLTGTADQVLTLEETDQSDGNAYSTRLSTDPEVLRNPTNPNSPVIASLYNNLDDFEDTLIYKIPLRPRDRATFDTWATNIYKNNLVHLQFRLESDAYMLHKKTEIAYSTLLAAKSLTFKPDTDTSTSLTSHFTLQNSIVYEIYHPDNVFNPLGTHTHNGEVVNKRIGKVDNNEATQATYIFHNLIDNEYEICTCDISKVRRRDDGEKVNPSSLETNVPLGYAESRPAAGGDAMTNYYYNHNNESTIQANLQDYYYILTRDDPNGINKDYGIRRYKLLNPNNSNDLVSLVRMPDDLNFDEAVGEDRVYAAFTYRNTQRRFCHVDCFAGFIGVLIQLHRDDIICTGMCFGDSTSYPSVTHPNGDSVDTTYLANLQREQLKVNAFRDHYFTNILRGSASWYPNLVGTRLSAGHNDHLHAGDFSSNSVVILNGEEQQDE